MKSIYKMPLLAVMIAASMTMVACSDKAATDSAATDGATADTTTDTAATANDKLETKFVTIATGGASGPYNIIGTSLAEIYAKTFGVNAKTQTTGASVENVNLLT